MAKLNEIVLETSVDRLRFDAATGRLVGLAPLALPEESLIAPAGDQPALAIGYLDARREYRHADSLAAASVYTEVAERGHERTLTITISRVGGLSVDAVLTVRVSTREPLSRWSLTLRNQRVEIVDVQFPFVVAPYAGKGHSAIVHPIFHGQLIPDPQPQHLRPDCPQAWQFHPVNGDTAHYPGSVFAQFLAFHNDRAGLYVACEDTHGNVKLIKPLHRDPGIRLGVAHVGDWPIRGERTLEYDVVLGSFRGDWTAAAEMYRGWSLQQKWAMPLHQRTDVPAWLLDSPPHITLRMQGVLDEGPTPPTKEFLPYEKAIPLLARVAKAVEAPLVAVIMSWERGGPWIYPDCFPPVGGDASVTLFAKLARQRGWHVGSFCNGSRWAVGHFWNRYDGRAFFEEHGGAQTLCRLPDGQPWKEAWDQTWRPSYACCLGVERTQAIARDFVKRLVGWGLESIQFFDQNVGAATFPCFAADHPHPPMPGKWMAEKMSETIHEFEEVAKEAGETGVLQSVEQCCNEYCLQLFQQCDVRTAPGGQDRFVPLYHYLFHECMIMHGMMSTAPEPYHLPIATAFNGVLGEIPGAVMISDGTLLNRETYNWAPWEPRVGSNADALAMMRTVTAMRRGPGRDFLVFGRMMPPAEVDAKTIEWTWKDRVYRLPAVFDVAWRAPDGRFAVALANWTAKGQKAAVRDARLGTRATVHTAGRKMQSRAKKPARGRLTVILPPLSFVLIEAAAEQASGMDPLRLRKKFGKSVCLCGGLDKREIANGAAAIDKERYAKIPPLLEQGGYIPHIDHAISPEISYPDFMYYMALKRKLIGQ